MVAEAQQLANRNANPASADVCRVVLISGWLFAGPELCGDHMLLLFVTSQVLNVSMTFCHSFSGQRQTSMWEVTA
jgi:hypothetical protein